MEEKVNENILSEFLEKLFQCPELKSFDAVTEDFEHEYEAGTLVELIMRPFPEQYIRDLWDAYIKNDADARYEDFETFNRILSAVPAAKLAKKKVRLV